MPDPGEIAIVHLTGRLVDGPDAGEVFETTDVDVALDEGVYHDHRDFKPSSSASARATCFPASRPPSPRWTRARPGRSSSNPMRRTANATNRWS
ncbi:hypothetical protein ACFQH6_14980 [Halobacteriaceae archaeon GCM10025711]